MNRLLISIVVEMVLVVAGVAFGQSEEERARLRGRWQNMSEQERREFRAQMRERFESGGWDIDRKGQLKAYDAQIAKLRAEHEELIGELKAIHGLAVKEKAEETTKRLENLIADRQKEFKDRLQQLEQRRQRLQRRRRSDRKASEFTLKSFDGKTVSLSDYKGKIVVLEWFNLDCPSVKYHYDTATTMFDLANKYEDKNVVWLAINSTANTTSKKNKKFARKHKLPYLILDDRSGEVGRAYGAKTTPHMYIIDSNGYIVYKGAIDNSPMGSQKEGLINYVDKALAELTTGKAVSIQGTKPYGCSVKYSQ